ncbi:MAG TPA: hypothetical protein DDZ80_02410 [Cyanobacteria bacterium UBA8803]|nr:hypothetical protein [Cyanobacteria bacterium UBA9273]HBL57436.1 hypothetical protein [Cyanobacteria bacterium UBA8803]
MLYVRELGFFPTKYLRQQGLTYILIFQMGQVNSIIAYVEGQVKSARECRSKHLEQLQGKYKHVSDALIMAVRISP